MGNKLEKAINKTYLEIGKFTVHFEFVTHEFIDCIKVLLKKQGLKEGSSIEIILDRFTADSVRNKFKSLIFNYLPPEDKRLKPIDALLKQYASLIEIRNLFIHGLWILSVTDYADKKHVPSFMGIKHRVKNDKVSLYNMKGDTEVIELINLKIDKLLKFVEILKEDLKNDSDNLVDGGDDVKKTIEEINSVKFDKILRIFKSDPMGEPINIDDFR